MGGDQEVGSPRRQVVVSAEGSAWQCPAKVRLGLRTGERAWGLVGSEPLVPLRERFLE